MLRYLLLPLLLLVASCAKLPKEKYNQFDMDIELVEMEGHTMIQIKNPILAPLRIWVSSDLDTIQNQLESTEMPIVFSPLADTSIQVLGLGLSMENFSFRIGIGDPAYQVSAKSLALPFQQGSSYNLMQGYNSKPSHNTDYSRYAFDFDLEIGDTICAATGGFVVGVIEGYSKGGENKKWRPYANFITLFDPSTGLYTQYVHLDHMGSLVELGDTVALGQAIGISGSTGYSTDPHLHFNVLKTVNTGQIMISMPLDSIGNYKVSDLRRGQSMIND